MREKKKTKENGVRTRNHYKVAQTQLYMVLLTKPRAITYAAVRNKITCIIVNPF